jgi:hypothetical protein
MSLGFTKTIGTTGIPVWQGFPEPLPGGFKVANTGMSAGQVFPAGSLCIEDEVARTCVILGGAKAYATAGGAATTYNVYKGSGLKVGDYLAKSTAGGKAYAITAIDTTTSNDYDIVTVGTTIGAVTAGDQLYASTATGATASALPAATSILHQEVIVSGAGIVDSCSVVKHGHIYARRMPLYSADVAALTGLKNIIFMQSK